MKSLLSIITAPFTHKKKPPIDAPLEQAEKPLAGRHFVLDGTNIALLHGPKRPELRYVLAIAEFCRENGASVSCFFDANTGYLFRDGREGQSACFETLTTAQPWAKNFGIVPSGTQADPWILQDAKEKLADVVSNDRFKDRAKAHRWIWKRRHDVYVVGGRLQLPSISAELDLLTQPEDYLAPLASLPIQPNGLRAKT
ncbi:NYN domain-containing protein [Congregibacter sp.]|uniref:NYN domain-containing protein n=1 Tax=Congregibacter sp. TaxID=2744308 RepID=UPI00385FAC30